mgnify:CR=1 FL=1
MSSYLDKDVAISFEFFPPSDDAGEARLWETVRELAPLGPEFLSVTYGAGGSTQVHTDRIVRRIAKETDLTPTAHLPALGDQARVDDLGVLEITEGTTHDSPTP